MHLPRCLTDEKRSCRMGRRGACARCPELHGRTPQAEVITASELREFAAACLRLADNDRHPKYRKHGWPYCKWCGTRDMHRCPEAVFAGQAARFRVDRRSARVSEEGGT